MTEEEFDKQNDEWLKNLEVPKIEDKTKVKPVEIKVAKVSRDGNVKMEFN